MFMRNLRSRSLIVLATLACGASLAPHAARAQTTLTWDANTATAGAQDGSGTWDPNTTADWYNGAADQTWGNPTTPPNLALFGVGGTSGTVTIAGTINVGGITFSQGGYTLAAATSGSGVLNFIPTTTGGSVVFTTSGAGQVSTITDNVGFSTSTANQKFTKTGSGTLVLSQTNTTATVSFTTPTFTITGGTFNSATNTFDSVLQVGGAVGRVLGSGGTIVLDGGTLQLYPLFGGSSLAAATRALSVNAGGGAFVDGSSGANNNNSIQANFTNNAGAGSSLYLSNSVGKNTNFQNVTSGTGGVTWNGGTGTFSNTNTYTGATVVGSGVMAITGSLAAGSAVSVNGGTLTGTGTVAGATTIAAAGMVNPGAVGVVGTLTTGADTFLGGSTLTFDFGGNAVDKLVSTGLVTGLGGTNFVFNSIGGVALSSASYTLISASGFSSATLPASVTGLPSGYQLQYSGNNLNLVQITGAAAPEPSAWVSLGLGLMGLGGYAARRSSTRRRRRV